MTPSPRQLKAPPCRGAPDKDTFRIVRSQLPQKLVVPHLESDPNSELLKALGGQMIPFVVVIDGKGNIVSKHSGYTDGAENELLEEVKKLIGQ